MAGHGDRGVERKGSDASGLSEGFAGRIYNRPVPDTPLGHYFPESSGDRAPPGHGCVDDEAWPQLNLAIQFRQV